MQGGTIRDSIEFKTRALASDGMGNTVGSFESQFTVMGNVKYLRGGESVMAARVAAKQPAIITVRVTLETQLIAPDWVAVIDGKTFNIREHPTKTDNRLYYQFLAESGVAGG